MPHPLTRDQLDRLIEETRPPYEPNHVRDLLWGCPSRADGFTPCDNCGSVPYKGEEVVIRDDMVICVGCSRDF